MRARGASRRHRHPCAPEAPARIQDLPPRRPPRTPRAPPPTSGISPRACGRSGRRRNGSSTAASTLPRRRNSLLSPAERRKRRRWPPPAPFPSRGWKRVPRQQPRVLSSHRPFPFRRSRKSRILRPARQRDRRIPPPARHSRPRLAPPHMLLQRQARHRVRQWRNLQRPRSPRHPPLLPMCRSGPRPNRKWHTAPLRPPARNRPFSPRQPCLPHRMAKAGCPNSQLHLHLLPFRSRHRIPMPTSMPSWSR